MTRKCKKFSMAECVNCGLGNEEIRQGIMSPSPMFAEMLLRGMQDLKCVQDSNSVPSQNEKNDSIPLTLDHQDSNNLESPVLDILSNVIEPIPKDSPEDSTDDQKSPSRCAANVFSAANKTQVPSDESLLYFLPMNYNKRNLWRRVSGFHSAGNELRSATYPARSSIKKLRFAQAKKPLTYLYSYFSIEILDCDEISSLTIGVTRKDYPCKSAPGKVAGSIGYFADTGSIFLRDSAYLDGPQFSKGDVIGCGLVYPSHYKRYADLSTDDNSDGMTDVVLTSLLHKKSMDFVCNVLNLNAQADLGAHGDAPTRNEDADYYNENFVESRSQVEVYFTHNMQVIGKVLSYIPIGGFYPTVHMISSSAIQMKVDLNPPSS